MTSVAVSHSRLNASKRRLSSSVSLEMFRCEPMRCTLSRRQCAERYARAQVPLLHPERLDMCRHCEVGAENAGGA